MSNSSTLRYICTFPECGKRLKTIGGRTQHFNACHQFIPANRAGAFQRTPSPLTHSSPPQSPIPLDFPDLPPHEEPPSVPSTSKRSRTYHPYLTGSRLNAEGHALPENAPPPQRPVPTNPFEPFADDVQFRLADLLFRKVQMAQTNIDELCEIIQLAMNEQDTDAPFKDHQHIHATIDDIQHGSAPWHPMT